MSAKDRTIHVLGRFGEGLRTKVKRYTYEEGGITYRVLSFHIPVTEKTEALRAGIQALVSKKPLH